MNYRKRQNIVSRKTRTSGGWGFLRRMKKVRGKINRRKVVVKIHSVSDTDFILGTSFAMYKIPRSFFVAFKNASQQAIQNIVGYCSLASCYGLGEGHFLSIYWYDLDEVFDVEQFEKFKVYNDK